MNEFVMLGNFKVFPSESFNFMRGIGEREKTIEIPKGNFAKPDLCGSFQADLSPPPHQYPITSMKPSERK